MKQIVIKIIAAFIMLFLILMLVMATLGWIIFGLQVLTSSFFGNPVINTVLITVSAFSLIIVIAAIFSTKGGK